MVFLGSSRTYCAFSVDLYAVKGLKFSLSSTISLFSLRKMTSMG